MSTELHEQDILEKGREEGREEGEENTLLADIRSLIETLHLSVEEAMNALKVPMEARARLSARL